MTSRRIAAFVSFAFLLTGAFYALATPTVVLPERFKNSPVLVENSVQFKAIVAKNKDLQKQLVAEQKAHQELQDRTDKDLRDKDTELQKLRAEKVVAQKSTAHSIFGLIFSAARVVLSFISNPFSFIITRVVEVAVAIAIVIGLIFGIKIFLHTRKNKNPNPPSKAP